MNLFGVGPTEIIIVLLVILVLFGPDRLPELAKKIGGASRDLRNNLDTINEQMNNALDVSMELDKARMLPPAPSTTLDSERSSGQAPTEPAPSAEIPPATSSHDDVTPPSVLSA